MAPYLVVTGLAAVVAYLVTPGVRVLAIKIGAVDVPHDRKVHHAPTPTLGGIALFVAFITAMGAAALMTEFRSTFQFTEVFGLAVGGLGALLLGAADDTWDLQPPVKAAGQILVAGVLFLMGVRISFFWVPWLGVLSLSADLSAIVTIAWVLLLMNAVNFMDGLDGLAAGLSAIASGAFLLYYLWLESEGLLGFSPLAPLASAAILGCCVGFLRHNFNPARIFMGDAGALLLGFLLAGATISAIGQSATPGPEAGRLALPFVLAPIVFLAVPITDLLFAVARRLATGVAFDRADKEHIHHRLLTIGHSQRQAVIILYLWAMMLAGSLVVAALVSWGRFLVLFSVAFGTLAVFTLGPRLRRGLRSRRLPSYAPPDESRRARIRSS